MEADNCSVFFPWLHNYSNEPWGLGGNLLTSENELLARTLHFTLYDPSLSFQVAASTFMHPESSSISGNSSAASDASSSGPLVNRLTTAEAMETGGRWRNAPLVATGRVAKRKSRASKKRPTTYINADMANFREMVQRVTGVQVGGAGGDLGGAAPLEPEAKTGTLLPPAVRGRAGLLSDSLQQFRLPTLDTSELFLERRSVTSPGRDGSLGSGLSDEALDGGFDFESSLLPVDDFATFESWAAMAMQ